MLKRSRLVLPRNEYKKLCNEVMTRDNWKCRSCKKRQDLHCHHVVYRSAGGDDLRQNLITLCSECHEGIHSRYLVVRQGEPTTQVNTDKPVYWLLIGGWKPGVRR